MKPRSLRTFLRPGPGRRRGLAGLALLSLLGGCGPRPERSLDLLGPGTFVELRSDLLDLPFVLAQPTLERGGWRERRPGKGALWSRDPEAWLELPFATTTEKELLLTAHTHATLGSRVDAVVSLNGHAVGALALTPRNQQHRLALPAAVQVEGRNVVELKVPGWKDKVAGPRKRRRSYIAVKELAVRPLVSGATTRGPVQDGRGLHLPAPSSASIYLREGAPFEIDLEAEVAVGTTRVSLSLDRGASRETLADLSLLPGGRRRVSARGRPSEDGFLRLEVANRGPADVRLGSVVLRSSPRPVAEPPSPVRDAFLRRPRPNLVIFLADTLRADHLGLYGHRRPTSPRLDAFAREAVTFDEAWSVSSWTAPSVASIFTGLGPETHGVSGLDIKLVEGVETLAESLRTAGYRTGAFVANSLVESSRGFAQGFDTWNGKSEAVLYSARPLAVVNHALRWLDAAPEPFFLYVHTLDPHGPYQPPAAHRKLFEAPAAKEPKDRGRPEAAADARSRQMGRQRAAYEGEIHEADAALGVFVDALRERGLLERSLVGFTADHGEEFDDHGGEGHGRTLYPEVVRVPLVVRLPDGALGGQRVTTPVQNTDLLPTLLRLAGATLPKHVEGRPLWESWPPPGARQGAGRLLFGRLRLGGPDGRDKVYVRDERLKLIVNYELRLGAPARMELFDLRADPENRVNLAGSRALAVRYLRDQMRAIEKAQAELRGELRAGETIELSPEQIERLRALGYVGG